MAAPLAPIPGDPSRDHRDLPALIVVTGVARRITGADIGAIAIPVGAGGFVLECVSGPRAAAYEGVVVPHGHLVFEPEVWARGGLSWCAGSHVLPEVAHALFAPVPGTRSPTVALVVANHEVSRLFREDQAVALAELTTHPSVAAIFSSCSATRPVWECRPVAEAGRTISHLAFPGRSMR